MSFGTQQLGFQRILQERYVEFRKKRPGLSLRAYARHLQTSPSAISEILRGKRRVSPKLMEKVIDRLELILNLPITPDEPKPIHHRNYGW
jgi:hypothetical protein